MKKHIIFLFTLISMIGTNVWALALISSKWMLRQTELTMQLKGHRIGQANL